MLVFALEQSMASAYTLLFVSSAITFVDFNQLKTLCINVENSSVGWQKFIIFQLNSECVVPAPYGFSPSVSLHVTTLYAYITTDRIGTTEVINVQLMSHNKRDMHGLKVEQSLLALSK